MSFEGDKGLEELDFEFKLQKIRNQITSKLENQKHLALILSAVEENINDQNNSKSPVAYFVSFLSLLDQAIDSESDEILDSALAISSAYFLDLTLPFIPKTLLKSKFPEILTKLAPAITNSNAEAALIRSAIGALETLLIAQDLNSWNNTSLNINPRRGFGGLLEYSLDPRPKVRKRAQEAIHKILANSPPGPALEHVASGMAADFAIKSIVTLLSTKPNQKTNKEHSAQLIHALQLISSITSANTWPAAKIENLCDLLLEISKTNDQYLVSAAFGGFEGLFNSMTNEIDNDKFVKVLNIIFDLKPSINDSHLAAPWIAVVSKGVTAYSKIEPLEAVKKIPQVLEILKAFFASEVSDIYISASQSIIAIISEGIPEKFLLLPNGDDITPEIYEEVDDVITQISEIITELLSVKYTSATKEILEVIATCFTKLRMRTNPDFLKPLEIVGEWRTNEDFEHKAEAEAVIGNAITELGPEVVLNVLPLNLLDANKTGRAWLLPLLRDNVRFARLGYFIQHFMPLIEAFSEKVGSLDKNSVHSKIFQTIIDQTWSLLPHFADLPNDLQKSFTDEFAQTLSQLLYSNVELRVNVCHALRLLVESNVAYANGALADDELLSQQFSIKEAQSNVEYLATKSSNILAVLFNVFSQTVPESRGFVMETIDAYLSISTPTDLEATFNKVSSLLKDALESEANQQQAKNKSKLSVTMMDLVVAMAKYVPESSYYALFMIFNQVVTSEEPLLQKRAYRIISKLVETPTGTQALSKFIESIEKVIIDNTNNVHPSAKAARLSAISTILEILPSDHLNFIPGVLSEITLSTTSVNEKTRELSYKTLIEMGNVMNKGGVVKLSKLDGFPDDTPDSEGSLEEYLKMVLGGLGGDNNHQISITITAISCLIYEFKDQIPTDLLVEITSTVDLFLTTNNKEIAKSAIGFAKIAAISLPEELVRPKLKTMLENLLRWSHEHTGHFKSKVKHIIERLIRRFGFEAIEENFPEEDKKLLNNIRKTKARAKRRQAEEGEEDAEDSKKSKFSNAYEEVLYESEDEDEDDAEEGNNKKGNQYILQSNDEPLDLLDRQALSHISSSKPQKKGGRKINASEFEKDGRLHFNDKNNADDEDPLKSITSGINAYVEAVRSGPVKGQKNKFKFKRGAKAYNDEDDGEDDGEETSRPARNERPKFVNKNNKVGKPKQKFKARKKF